MKRLWASSASQRARGFTLIEIMVVVAIIAVLATIVIVAYQGFGERSRDSQRTSDVSQIKIALDKYYADNSQYPDACGGTEDCPVTALATPLSQYLKQMPSDPIAARLASAEYAYSRTTAGDGYAIKIVYEDQPTCMTGVRIVSSWWNSIPKC